MAGVQGSELCIAVSRAGGLGSLPCAMLSVEKMREEMAAISSATDRPYNVNFFCHTPAVADPGREQAWRAQLAPFYAELGVDPADIPPPVSRAPFTEEALAVLEEFKPAVVSFHFGLPEATLLARVKKIGSVVISSATTVAEARWLESRGVDAVIAQGVEAGGHRGMFLTEDLNTQSGIMALLPQVLDAVTVPVIAAGGIASASGVAAALSLGARAVQMGTVFLLCWESGTSAVHRAALASEAATSTALTNVFSGRPARSIVNRAVRELGPLSAVAPAFPTAGTALGPLRKYAEAAGSGDFSPLWAGQNVTGCQAVPAADLLRQLRGNY